MALVVVLSVTVLCSYPPIYGEIKGSNNTVEITDSPPNETATKQAYFEFKSNQERVTFECKLDNGQFEKCISPKSYDELGVGFHTFQVRVVDKGAFDETRDEFTWNIIDPTEQKGKNLIYGGLDPCLELDIGEVYFQGIEDSLVIANYDIYGHNCSKLDQIVTFDVKGLELDYEFDLDYSVIEPDSYLVITLHVYIPQEGKGEYSFEIKAKSAIEGNEGIYYTINNKQQLTLKSILQIEAILWEGTGDTYTFKAYKYFDPKEPDDYYSWDFGDGGTAEGKTVEHKYDVEGEHNVTLTTIDSQGKQITSSYYVYVSNVDVIYLDVDGDGIPDSVVGGFGGMTDTPGFGLVIRPDYALSERYLDYQDEFDILIKYIIPIVSSGLVLYYFLRKPIVDEKDYPKFYLERIFEK